jgi:hypothetical protein
MNHSRIERIRELFMKLKSGYDWCNRNKRNEAKKMELFERSKDIFDELEELGVCRSFSACIFFFSPEINDKLINQFGEKTIEKHV